MPNIKPISDLRNYATVLEKRQKDVIGCRHSFA